MCLKVKYPAHITLLRGSHESASLTKFDYFYDETIRKYGNANAWKHFVEIFNYLGLAAVIDDYMFCVHGGLSPAINTIDQINGIKRDIDIPHEGPLCDFRRWFGCAIWCGPILRR
eukprot:TRINITY_DN1668_c0_g1_i8.p2 TRINITY_DN1668_c0_g1~~TRINITY_DN1668_c0_g1_i8.p2  ORF type:complete len:115 (-),score=3.67 TRINITY_DN1668_c0_g1_i8:526-870(-)